MKVWIVCENSDDRYTAIHGVFESSQAAIEFVEGCTSPKERYNDYWHIVGYLVNSEQPFEKIWWRQHKGSVEIGEKLLKADGVSLMLQLIYQQEKQ